MHKQTHTPKKQQRHHHYHHHHHHQLTRTDAEYATFIECVSYCNVAIQLASNVSIVSKMNGKANAPKSKTKRKEPTKKTSWNARFLRVASLLMPTVQSKWLLICKWCTRFSHSFFFFIFPFKIYTPKKENFQIFNHKNIQTNKNTYKNIYANKNIYRNNNENSHSTKIHTQNTQTKKIYRNNNKYSNSINSSNR